ncbi:hypothetical protein N9021_03060, partial [Akkermansiaceae bacterium]|nr:hypothetical protein [Akkermansiaceae bacterium]
HARQLVHLPSLFFAFSTTLLFMEKLADQISWAKLNFQRGMGKALGSTPFLLMFTVNYLEATS